MKNKNILNPALISRIASIGHTQYFVICDAGLPVPKGAEVIDLSLVSGVPSFMQVMKAVLGELVIESATIADEIEDHNAVLYKEITDTLGAYPVHRCSHEKFKKMCEDAHTIVRTGETSPYANIILVAGVNF